MRRDWTRLYGTKKALILNPKTPADRVDQAPASTCASAIVRMIASSSKGIPSAVVAQARKLMNARAGGK
jgi:hypothetical protein